MADANKPVRLSKAAREFNLGIGTIVDFLDTKGISVDANPNTKLTPDVYAIVRGNFQGDKEDKEAAQRSSVSVSERENITLASARKRPAMKVEVEEQEIDLSIFKKSNAQPDVARSKSVEDELAVDAEKQKAKAASEAAIKAAAKSAAEEVENKAKLAQAEAAAKAAAQAAERLRVLRADGGGAGGRAAAMSCPGQPPGGGVPSPPLPAPLRLAPERA